MSNFDFKTYIANNPLLKEDVVDVEDDIKTGGVDPSSIGEATKKGNKEEQKRVKGAIKDDKDHIKALKKDIKDNKKKLAKLKKDYTGDINEEMSLVGILDEVKQDSNLLSEQIHETEMLLEGVMDTLKSLGAKTAAGTLKLPIAVLKGAFKVAKGIFDLLKGKKDAVKDPEISKELGMLDNVAGDIVVDLNKALSSINNIVNNIAKDPQVEETVPDEFFDVIAQLIQALRTGKKVALKIEKGDPAA